MSEQWFEPIYFEWGFLEKTVSDYDKDGVYSITSSDVLGYLINRVHFEYGKTVEELADLAGTGTRFIEDILAGQPRHEIQEIGYLLELLGIVYDYLEVPGYETKRDGDSWKSPWVAVGWAAALEPISSNEPRTPTTEISKPGGKFCQAINF